MALSHVKPQTAQKREILLSVTRSMAIINPLSKDRDGALAQLGERVLCKDEVRGSNPLSSTIRHQLAE